MDIHEVTQRLLAFTIYLNTYVVLSSLEMILPEISWNVMSSWFHHRWM